MKFGATVKQSSFVSKLHRKWISNERKDSKTTMDEDLEAWMRDVKLHMIETESEVRALRIALAQAEAERDLFFVQKQDSAARYAVLRERLQALQVLLDAGGELELKLDRIERLMKGETLDEVLQGDQDAEAC